MGGEWCTLEPLITFLIVLCFFHLSEFCLAACYMRQDLSARCEIATGPANQPQILTRMLPTLVADACLLSLQPGSSASPTAQQCLVQSSNIYLKPAPFLPSKFR